MAFERLLVVDRVLGGERRLDLGRLAEDLVFYGEVRMHIGKSELGEIVSGIGPDNLIALMDRGVLRLAYANNIVSARTRTDGVIALYEPLLVSAEHLEIEAAVTTAFQECQPDKAKASKQARRFVELADDRPHDIQICAATRDFLDDADAVEAAVKAVLSIDGGLPEGHEPLRFRPARQESGLFTVDTNIAFDKLNDGTHLARGPLDTARLIAFFTSARSKLMLASEESADFDTNVIDAVLLTSQIQELVSRRTRSSETLLQFQHMTLGNGNTVADAINRGDRDFGDVLTLLDKVQRFHDWIQNQEPNAELLHQYYRKVTDETWVAKLPAKTFRWLIATAGGAALAGAPGLLVGAALGALDTFLVERLVAGWRPNQFVDGDLRRFVDAY